MTALATEEDRRRSLADGFDMHLTKPVDSRRLWNAVIELTDRRRHLPSPAPSTDAGGERTGDVPG